MRPERNPLDLNNLPEDYSREGKQVIEESSIMGFRKKKSSGKDGKDECGKIYECRFCSLKFCKSQALGGHMNRHRQEREIETLNRARQLVFSNETLAAQVPPHLGLTDPNLGGAQPMPPAGSFHQSGNLGDPSIHFRSAYPTRLYSASSSTFLSPPPQPPPQYLYSTSSSRLPSAFPSQCPPHPIDDYLVGHVLTGNSPRHPNLNYSGAAHSNYTCIGAPLPHSCFPPVDGDLSASGGGGGGDRDGSQHNQEDGLNWGRRYAGLSQQRLDPSSINRFQDGFRD